MAGYQNDQGSVSHAWTQWVLSGPYRAWLSHLCAATNLGPQTIAVAIGIPTSVARALSDTNRRRHRIRAIDAYALMRVNIESLRQRSRTQTDASPAQDALDDLGAWCPGVPELAKHLGVTIKVAADLMARRIDHCPSVVVWRCVALAQDIMNHNTKQVLGQLVAAEDDQVHDWASQRAA